eukprot:TRINITY_DN5051_c0_g1_i1.p1 TRINITY_DN5051_c0_g1~~TRINITY_DN5051_c0_g1_i1.p1  ORF type:complete len:505 (+),score=101.26 TRINITY_DN5051_c0_g1_i1:722-2236(+)
MMPSLPHMPESMPHMPNLPQMPQMTSASSAAAAVQCKVREKFDELDVDQKGKLTREAVEKGLRDLGRTAEDIQKELGRTELSEFSFKQFRLMSKPPQVATSLHSLPGFGAMTTVAAEAYYSLSDEELQDAFEHMDLDGNGSLCKAELTEALEGLGKSERRIHEILDPFPDDVHLDFEAFKNLMKPKQVDLSSLDDKTIRASFDKFDSAKTGALSREAAASALRDVGRSEANVQCELRRTKIEKFEFFRFRLMAKPPKSASSLHDVPGFGAFTAAAAESYYTVKDEDLEDAFHYMDVDGSGHLTKDELCDALAHIGKCHRKVKEYTDPLFDDVELDIAAWKHLVKPKKASTSCDEKELKKLFDKLDTGKKGTLTRETIANALREVGRTEADVQRELRRTKKNDFTFDNFRLMAKPPKTASTVHNVPGFGAFTAAMSSSYYTLSDQEVQDAFNHVDLDGNGTLSKDELYEALHDLGKPDRKIGEILDPLADDVQLDLEGFKKLLKS